MQKIGATGYGKSAVATPDGNKPKEEEEDEELVLAVSKEEEEVTQDSRWPVAF